MLDPGSAVHHPHLPPTHTAEELRGQKAIREIQPHPLPVLRRGCLSEQYYHPHIINQLRSLESSYQKG